MEVFGNGSRGGGCGGSLINKFVNFIYFHSILIIKPLKEFIEFKMQKLYHIPKKKKTKDKKRGLVHYMRGIKSRKLAKFQNHTCYVFRMNRKLLELGLVSVTQINCAE